MPSVFQNKLTKRREIQNSHFFSKYYHFNVFPQIILYKRRSHAAKAIQVDLVIRGLFICEFAYPHFKHWSKRTNFKSKCLFLSFYFADQNSETYRPRITRLAYCISLLQQSKKMNKLINSSYSLSQFVFFSNLAFAFQLFSLVWPLSLFLIRIVPLRFPPSLRLPLISKDLPLPHIWSRSIKFANLRDKIRASSDERLLLLFSINLPISKKKSDQRKDRVRVRRRPSLGSSINDITHFIIKDLLLSSENSIPTSP